MSYNVGAEELAYRMMVGGINNIPLDVEVAKLWGVPACYHNAIAQIAREAKHNGVQPINVVDVTPDMAKKLLSHTSRTNRKKKDVVQERMEADMRDGNWAPQTGTAMVDVAGNLRDAGHRFRGVEATGTTQRFNMQWGATEESIVNTDIGSSRHTHDTLALSGLLDAATSRKVTEAVKNVIGIRNGVLGGNSRNIRKVSTSAIQKFIQGNPYRLAAVTNILKQDLKGLKYPPIALMTLPLLIDEVHFDIALSFVEELTTMAGTTDFTAEDLKDPVVWVYARHLQEYHSDVTKKVRSDCGMSEQYRAKTYGILFAGWDAYSDDRPMAPDALDKYQIAYGISEHTPPLRATVDKSKLVPNHMQK